MNEQSFEDREAPAYLDLANNESAEATFESDDGGEYKMGTCEQRQSTDDVQLLKVHLAVPVPFLCGACRAEIKRNADLNPVEAASIPATSEEPKSNVKRVAQFHALPDLLTPRDLMRILPIGRDAAYLLLHRNQIPSVRIGRKFVIPKHGLEAFVGMPAKVARASSSRPERKKGELTL